MPAALRRRAGVSISHALALTAKWVFLLYALKIGLAQVNPGN